MRFERVLTAFKPYIEQADYVEIVWSNKKQCYVALFIDTTRDTFEGADAILSAEEISERFYTEIGNDILLENDREYQIWEMSPLEREEFLRRIPPRMTPSCRNIISWSSSCCRNRPRQNDALAVLHPGLFRAMLEQMR